MTIDEATEKCKVLEKLNLDLWDAPTSFEKQKIRDEFKKIANELTSNGIRCRKWMSFDNNRKCKVPRFSIIKPNNENCVSIIDNRAEGGNHHGDCTTRCISFCTGVDYLTIQKEQFANLAKAKSGWSCGLTWRSPTIWTKSLLTRGFCELILPRKVTRKVFLRMFNDSGIDYGTIATKSSRHVAAIDMKTKKILDTWDSSGGRIISIFVPMNCKYKWIECIEKKFGKSPKYI